MSTSYSYAWVYGSDTNTEYERDVARSLNDAEMDRDFQQMQRAADRVEQQQRAWNMDWELMELKRKLNNR